MQSQKTLPASSEPKINVKRMTLYARISLFILILSGVIITGVLAITTGGISPSTLFSGILTLIIGVATVIPLYPVLFSASPDPASTNNVQGGSVVQSAEANRVAAQSTGNTHTTIPNNIQSGNLPRNGSAMTDQPIFFFNLPLCDPCEFYGHTAARTTLITRTANGGSSSIVGERRAGKTWLLEYLQLVAPTHNKLGPAYRIGSICATHPECKTLAGFVRLALKELKVTSPAPDLQPLSQFSRIVRDLKQLGFRAVLCIDEFEGFNNRQEFNVDFVEGLRAMAQNDGLVLVTASKRPLKELIEALTGQTSPLFNIVQQIPLSPFTEKEAREFVRNKSNMAGFTRRESDFFFDQSTLHNTNGEPYWPPLRLQLVGQILLDDKQAAQGQPLNDKLDDFRYRSEFETRLS